jgi:hypothetical protein
LHGFAADGAFLGHFVAFIHIATNGADEFFAHNVFSIFRINNLKKNEQMCLLLCAVYKKLVLPIQTYGTAWDIRRVGQQLGTEHPSGRAWNGTSDGLGGLPELDVGVAVMPFDVERKPVHLA